MNSLSTGPFCQSQPLRPFGSFFGLQKENTLTYLLVVCFLFFSDLFFFPFRVASNIMTNITWWQLPRPNTERFFFFFSRCAEASPARSTGTSTLWAIRTGRSSSEARFSWPRTRMTRAQASDVLEYEFVSLPRRWCSFGFPVVSLLFPWCFPVVSLVFP